MKKLSKIKKTNLKSKKKSKEMLNKRNKRSYIQNMISLKIIIKQKLYFKNTSWH